MTEEQERKPLTPVRKRYLMCDIFHGMTWMAVMLGGFCWTIMVVEGINLAQRYGFIIEGNPIHAFGAMFITLFLILFPLNWWLYRVNHYFRRRRKEIWRES